MVLPITGPHEVIEQLLTPSQPTIRDYRSVKNRYKQARPYDRPLPYSHRGAVLIKPRWGVEAAGGGYDAELASQGLGYGVAHLNDLKIKAYEKLKADFASSAELGAAVATFSQSLGMIANRSLQLFRFGRKLKKFQFRSAIRELTWPDGKPPPYRGPPKSRQFGSMWLEYSYGWAPMVGDIFNALEVLGKTDLGERSIKGTARSNGWFYTDGNTNPWNLHKRFENTIVAVKYQANVRVTNPNLVLWNQLGLLNPATVIWEVIPFSFVVDWFVNVQQFLGLGTDFMGVEKTHEFTTSLARGEVTITWGTPPGGGSKFYVWRVDRVLGIDKPSLAVRPLRVWGWQRGLNAASLLTQFLKSV